VGEGVKLRAGKMVTHMGYETINPTTNPLFSHSYLFGFAIPFTHTGAMAFYKLSDEVTVMGGFSRGWEQSLEDSNDSLDALAQVMWTVNDKFTLIFSNTTGPEAAGNNSDYRTVFDVIATYQLRPDLQLALNGDYGYESDAAANGGDAQWFGMAGYATQKLNDNLSATGRLEWFDDHDGARGLGTTVYEATLGVSRFDHAVPDGRGGIELQAAAGDSLGLRAGSDLRRRHREQPDHGGDRRDLHVLKRRDSVRLKEHPRARRRAAESAASFF
jgi:hypothetical protein